jgi:hypothetical protein
MRTCVILRLKRVLILPFCMLGSLEVETNKEFLAHLDSVAACLKRGGLYPLDGGVQFDWTRLEGENWTVIKDGLVINVTLKCCAAELCGTKNC